MQKKWEIKSLGSAESEELCRSLWVSRLLSRLLNSRGIHTVSDGNRFLNPSLSAMNDPFLLKGMEQAVVRLLHALHCSETVCIYGDYDVDGISGTALLVSFLRRIGMECRYFIPNRFDDGYGLSTDALQRIADSGATLVMSVDCGIVSVDEALFCKQAGLDLIILDHHTPGARIPDAVAVVNPLQPGCSYPFKALAGVGVAFNLLVALRSRMRDEQLFAAGTEPDLREWLDLVALGTIADVVPLVDQNRLYAFFGLQKLATGGRAGITALKKVAGITDTVSCGQVGFRLAPRLNAAGRMESAVPGVDLLLGRDTDLNSRIAEELDTANAERQTIEKTILEQAIAMVENSGMYPECRSIVLASREWHQGVIGIVASRLVERFHRPTILIAIDEQGQGKGSGRSIPGFHLLNALTDCAGHLGRFGGHRYAAGVGLPEENVHAFIDAFEAATLKVLGTAELLPTLDIDCDVDAADLNLDLVTELKRLEPFGAGNPEPTLMLRGVTVVERRVVGDGHLKLRLASQGRLFNAIAFRQADCSTDGQLDIAFFPESNCWNSSTTLQLRIKAIRRGEG